MEFEAALKEHAGHVALQFSGGRDSLALLLYMRPFWSQLTVYFSNPGDSYPETMALIDAVRSVVPSFVEVRGHVHEVHSQHGWPSDVVQAGASWPFGKEQINGHLKLIDRYSCCYLSHMRPLHERMRQDGVTLILRGQRDSDEPKSHVEDGETVDGFTIMYPIAKWSTDEVEQYIKDQGVPLPPYYAEGLTSAPDCMHCTAWLEHRAVKYLSKHHPQVHRVVHERLRQIKVVVQPFMANLDAALEH